MLLIGVFVMSCITVMPHAGSEIIGRRETCSNEGEEVKVDRIMDSTCFTCICKNGFVECLQGCPATEGCFQLIPKTGNNCCSKCKGCVYEGAEYASDTEWTDPQDPCRVLRCEAGVVTASDMQCYTPCDHPLPPQPGYCCPTCLGCRINGQRVTEERDVTIPEDPCLKCHCEMGRMTCSKHACPVLQCPMSHQVHPAGECCPQCRGTRMLMNIPSSCILQRHFLKFSQEMNIDSCTHCNCTNGTSVCERAACPVLLCLPEHQKTLKGNCCPHCPPVEETHTTCIFEGHIYKDGESWPLGPCKSCMCHDGEIRCAVERCPHQNVPCPLNHKLVHPPGQCCPKCVESDSVCTVFGDPHYKTFDGKFYSFQGSCKYQLTADCFDHSFSIRVTNDARKTKSSAWTKTISIKIKDLKINLGQKKRVKVNTQRVQLPFKLDNRVQIEKVDDIISVTTHIGVKLLWNGNSFLEVSVPTKYKGKLCGLCGNYNSAVRDDLTTRKGKLLNDTEIFKFGTSWRVGGKKACAREHDNSRKSRSCNRNQRWMNYMCMLLVQYNKFGNCDKKLNPSKYLKACTMDMCECPDGKCYCEAFTAYAHECQRLGVQLPNWKNDTNCNSNAVQMRGTPLPMPTHAPKKPHPRKNMFKKPHIGRPKNIGHRGPPPPLN